ncbi:MAG: hypothetical protein ACLQJ0_22990 [Steroidobacteraceae bacterium]
MLRASGANVLFVVAVAKFHAQAIRKVYDIGWKPMYFADIGAQSLKAVIQPAGVEKAVGLISATFSKSVTNPQSGEPEIKSPNGFHALPSNLTNCICFTAW